MRSSWLAIDSAKLKKEKIEYKLFNQGGPHSHKYTFPRNLIVLLQLSPRGVLTRTDSVKSPPESTPWSSSSRGSQLGKSGNGGQLTRDGTFTILDISH